MKYIKYAELTEAIYGLQRDYMKPAASAADSFKRIGATKALSQVMQICSDLCRFTDDLIDALNSSPFNRLLSTANAAARWNISEDAIRKAIQSNRLKPDIDCQKYGKQWIIDADAMTRVFGPQKLPPN